MNSERYHKQILYYRIKPKSRNPYDDSVAKLKCLSIKQYYHLVQLLFLHQKNKIYQPSKQVSDFLLPRPIAHPKKNFCSEQFEKKVDIRKLLSQTLKLLLEGEGETIDAKNNFEVTFFDLNMLELPSPWFFV